MPMLDDGATESHLDEFEAQPLMASAGRGLGADAISQTLVDGGPGPIQVVVAHDHNDGAALLIEVAQAVVEHRVSVDGGLQLDHRVTFGPQQMRGQRRVHRQRRYLGKVDDVAIEHECRLWVADRTSPLRKDLVVFEVFEGPAVGHMHVACDVPALVHAISPKSFDVDVVDRLWIRASGVVSMVVKQGPRQTMFLVGDPYSARESVASELGDVFALFARKEVSMFRSAGPIDQRVKLRTKLCKPQQVRRTGLVGEQRVAGGHLMGPAKLPELFENLAVFARQGAFVGMNEVRQGLSVAVERNLGLCRGRVPSNPLDRGWRIERDGGVGDRFGRRGLGPVDQGLGGVQNLEIQRHVAVVDRSGTLLLVDLTVAHEVQPDADRRLVAGTFRNQLDFEAVAAVCVHRATADVVAITAGVVGAGSDFSELHVAPGEVEFNLAVLEL
ncbi:hypothetical protein GQR58_029662 [Nymphon striatum]|nr:hypothetical protein GQR58_029662 [Nymphon striatum]